MIFLKIIFVALLCMPLLYISFILFNKLVDQVIEKKPKKR